MQRAAVGAAAASILGRSGRADETAEPALAPVQPAVAPESYFTAQGDFQDVSRGDPLPHSLPDEKKREVGLSRDTWKLEVISDAEHPAAVRRPFTAQEETAFDFPALMKLAETHAVRFPKVMTCLNIGCPLGMGIWEGVPLRDVVWLAQPGETVRRAFFFGYHNDQPKQMFRSSLPIDRVLEDPAGLPPVILCYKLNGQWLDSERGGPVRIVVPEGYGFKSIKWLTHVVLTNLFYANDTYGEDGNDVDSDLKSFAATIGVPREVPARLPISIAGYAQVGVSGLSKVQVWISPEAEQPAEGDKYLLKGAWQDAQILPPPADWGGDFPEGKLPADVMGFDAETGRPRTWPMRLCKAHWSVQLPGLPPGEYTLRCRTVDANGAPQPLPRPFRKSGHCAIEATPIRVAG